MVLRWQGAWARGRLVHVGDAAHAGPPDGTGANFALEDAAVLGACVRKHGLGPEVRAGGLGVGAGVRAVCVRGAGWHVGCGVAGRERMTGQGAHDWAGSK